MHDEEKDFYDYAAYYGIADFYDLSIAEVIALQILARYTHPVVRHELYTQVKQFVEFQEDFTPLKKFERKIPSQIDFYKWIEKKKVYGTSSFYNSLNNLEDRGLLQSDKSNRRRKFVEPTMFTNYIPKLLLKFLINNYVLINDEDLLKSAFKELEEKFNQGNVLSIWFSEYVVFSIVELLSEYVGKLYITHANEFNIDMKKIKKEKIVYTNIDNQKIREPENVFDAVIIPIYKKNPKFFGMTRQEILKECKRVVKPKGLICLVALADLPLTKNNYADELLGMYKLLMNNRIFTKEDLKDEMMNAGLNQVSFLEHQGLLIGIGYNS